MIPARTLYISVPDLDVLAALFLDGQSLAAEERFFAMQMIFGGHQDKYDYHCVGLDVEFLGGFLHMAEFVNVRRVEIFGIFNDSSALRFKGKLISLNMIAQKPDV